MQIHNTWKILSQKTSLHPTLEKLNTDAFAAPPTDLYLESNVRSSNLCFIVNESESIWKSFYPDGTVQVQTTLRNGISHGSHEVFYEDGKLMIRGTYRDGKMDGIWERFYANGRVELRELYENGVWKKTLEEYLPDGTALVIPATKTESGSRITEPSGNGNIGNSH